jgi:hypothetical protein
MWFHLFADLYLTLPQLLYSTPTQHLNKFHDGVLDNTFACEQRPALLPFAYILATEPAIAKPYVDQHRRSVPFGSFNTPFELWMTKTPPRELSNLLVLLHYYLDRVGHPIPFNIDPRVS